jgi:hypothetical protein
MYHESVERQPIGLSTLNTDYISRVMAVDYYDSLSDICSVMCDKYGSMSRTDSHHVCAFINLKGNKIILGENSSRTMPGCPISTHAEMDVLRKVLKSKSIVHGTVPKRIDKYDILVIRISKTYKLGSSRPCYHCINTMMNASSIKIRYVYYSTRDGKIARERLDEMLKSELTQVSTGWRARTNRSSGYSSDDSDETCSSSKSMSSSGSKSSKKSTSFDESVFPFLDLSIGERIHLPEKKCIYLHKKK